MLIAKYLQAHNISYERQVSFPDCVSPQRNYPLKFDFYIHLTHKDLLLEFDGSQHFYGGWSRTTDEVQRNDFIKDEYCKTHHLLLHRISFRDIDNLDTILDQLTSE